MNGGNNYYDMLSPCTHAHILWIYIYIYICVCVYIYIYIAQGKKCRVQISNYLEINEV